MTRKPPTRLDELISDIRACLDAAPPLPRVAQHGGCVVTVNYLAQAGITLVQFLERVAAEGLRFAYDAAAGDLTISK